MSLEKEGEESGRRREGKDKAEGGGRERKKGESRGWWVKVKRWWWDFKGGVEVKEY